MINEKLLAKVSAVNVKAAEYLESEEFLDHIEHVDSTELLSGAFTWKETPQGHKYWQNIDAKIDTQTNNN